MPKLKDKKFTSIHKVKSMIRYIIQNNIQIFKLINFNS